MTPRDRFLAACRVQPVDRPPVWLMRQAGRYLPEYRALREQHDFVSVCHRSELAAEVTLQPVRRFGMDAAILFSDILVVPEALGQTIAFPEGGPTVSPPLRTAADLASLSGGSPVDRLGFVGEALHRIRAELGHDRALLGFAGAPYTLATYMIEGGTSKNQAETKRIAFSQPELLDDLLARLASVVTDYLRLQLAAGADAVQLFDTWAGDLSPEDYERFALRPARSVIQGLTGLGAPVIYFVNGLASHLEAAATAGATVLGVDWRIDLAEVRRRVGPGVALQGNLDPLLLMASPAEIARRVRDLHHRLSGAPGHVFNLGHGVLPQTPLRGVEAFVAAVAALGDGA
jgi:uroporphyrinogen decarboxylase